ncbi:hypothetical protein FB45DRAFT_931345 [Roridomyces roridus]|uniref:F-box domain-containing protein n=1 Tax=Roridomyces roridus TaxID=1738132 RepID=A0AAD7BFQ6_9AGAR|nr:hypothetical protein FB45DRAFT_931345 [Roridomyces roridus]
MRTRSAHRAHMRITRWLPNEVLTEIIQNALRADQATLCRVSKLFHALALPSLNRTVVLHTNDSSICIPEAFCSAIIRNPERADSVRSLTFVQESYDAVHPEPSETLMESLKLMRKLEHLSLEDHRPHGVVPRLTSLTFPNLLSCILLGGNTEDRSLHITGFLSRHPTITHLRLRPPPGEDLPVPDGSLLPRLQCYDGGLGWLPSFSARSLAAVRTVWTVEFPSLANKLSALTSPALTLSIDFVQGDQITRLLDQLLTHLPHLGILKLLCWRMSTEEILTQITASLPRFRRLEYLAYDYLPGHSPDDADNDREVLKTWASVCPILKGSCIGEIAARKVGEQWEECSRSVFDTDAGFLVFDNVLSSSSE